MSIHSPETSLRDIYRAVMRHRKKAVAFFLMVMTAAVLYVLIAPPSYQSSAKIFVRLGRENLTLPPTATLGEKPVVTTPGTREDELNSVVEMLGSRAMVERVVEHLGTDTLLKPASAASADDRASEAGLVAQVRQWGQAAAGYVGGAVDRVRGWVSTGETSPREQAIQKLQKRLSVESPPRSNVVSVSYATRSPEAARRVVACLVDEYRRQHARLNRTEGSAQFFGEHAERLRKELREREEQLRELKTRTGLASIDEQRTQLIERIGALEDELIAAESARAESEAKVAALRKKLAEIPKKQIAEKTTGIGNAGTDMIREQVFHLQMAEKEAAAKYTDAHPRLRAIREELAATRAEADREQPERTHVKETPDANYESARGALLGEEPVLASLSARAKSLDGKLAGLRGQLKTLNEHETQIARLTREIELRDQDYRKYAANLEQARIDEALEAGMMSNISVVQPATLEPRPVWPRKTLVLALALIVGVGGAFGIALAAEYVDHSFRTPEDIERRLQIPTLVSIPRMDREALKLNGRN